MMFFSTDQILLTLLTKKYDISFVFTYIQTYSVFCLQLLTYQLPPVQGTHYFIRACYYIYVRMRAYLRTIMYARTRGSLSEAQDQITEIKKKEA